jgi:hypothetical protein
MIPRILPAFGFLLSLALASSAADPAQVIVLGGQSNMEGQATISEIDKLPADQSKDLKTELPNITFINAGKPGKIGEGLSFGPEVGFAHTLAAARPEQQFVLVKLGVGGTSMERWSASDAGGKRNGDLYRALVSSVHEAMRSGNSKVVAILWMQGEADTRKQALADTYFASQQAMIAGMRKEFSAPDAPFIFGRINPPATAKVIDPVTKQETPRYAALPTVRAAQEQVAKEIPNTILIETDDLSKRFDHLHYDGKGQLELGKRMAEAFLKTKPAQ